VARPGRGGPRFVRRAAPRVVGALGATALAAACAWLGPAPLPGPLLADLAARAETARGLRFPAPIDAERLAPERVRSVLAEELDVAASAADFARMEALEHSLGLLPTDVSLREALLDFQAGAVAGFYTPLRRRLYVVYDGPLEPALPPDVATVFVHELVHALQGSHSQLLDVLIGLDDHDDLAFALGALLEGDALLAAFRDREAQTGVARLAARELWADLDLEGSAAPGPEAPRLLRESFLLQYPLGYAIAEALAARGGSAALDGALRDPPLSSEALLHPEAYLGDAARTSLPWLELEAEALGAPECRVLARNSFGELGLRIWVREHGLSEARAAGAAAGWDGDRAAVLDCPEGRRVLWLAQLDAEVDAAELESAARAARSGLGVERRGRRVLLARGLGDAARAAALATPERRFPDLASYLAARPQVLARAERLRAAVRR
jgi:hypothetical protein